MRNLIQFIWKQHFTLLFIALQSIATFLLIQNNSFRKANFLGFANEFTGGAYEMVAEVTGYLQLKEVNKQLAAENARLKSNELTAYYGLTPLVRYVNDSAYMVQYEYTEAQTINSTVSQRNNYLTLNKGINAKVAPEMGVISTSGIVGIVKNTSDHYATVISLLHSKTQISSKLKNSDYFGILSWNGQDARVMQLSDIPSHVDLNVGDTVITRGSGGIFPPNLMVGTILDYTPIEGTDFYSINVKLAVDFNNVSYVYVVRNQLKIEQKELEKITLEEDHE